MNENIKECCHSKSNNESTQKNNHAHHMHENKKDSCKCHEGKACTCGEDCKCSHESNKNKKGFSSGCSSSFCKSELMTGTDEEDPERSQTHHKQINKSDDCCDHGTDEKQSHLDSGEVCHHDHHENHHHHDGSNRGFFGKISRTMGWSVESEHCGHHGHEDHTHTFDVKNWILALGTILGLITLYSMIFGLFFDGPIIQFLQKDLTLLTIGTVAYFIMGIAFVKGSIMTIRNKEIAEDTLVAIATTSAFLYSLSALIINEVQSLDLPFFFNEMVEILWLIYLGRFIEDWLTSKVTREIESLNDLKPKDAIVIRGGETLNISASQIVVGDIVVVKPGELIPVDGMVIEGTTTIDESSLTGESIPVFKDIGSAVFGGTISSNAQIKIEVTKNLEESFISKIISSVSESIKTKPKTQRIADKIASWLLPTVLVVAFVSFFATLIIYGTNIASLPNSFVNIANTESTFAYAYYIFITVLVIACPCSFAMTTPMCVLASQSTSKKNKVIFASESLFETIKSVDVICFDKTGTLTEGKFEVISNTIDENYIEELVSIEHTSNHPLANSIVNHFGKIKPKNIKVEEVIGMGVKSQKLMVGSLKWLNEFHPDYAESQEIKTKRNSGSAIVYAFNKETIVGYVELKDKVKSTTIEALSQIRKLGIEVIMITGDNTNTALNFASQLGIKSSNVYSEVSPNEKSSIIKKLQDEGKVVSFVGDGINDSIALVQSDIGIAMGEGSDAAIESADIVLGSDDLTLVSYSIWLSRRTLYTIKRGFGIAITYNSIMVPMAALGIIGLTGIGPTIAALSMIFNDSVAMLNAMTLKSETKNKFERKYKSKK